MLRHVIVRHIVVRRRCIIMRRCIVMRNVIMRNRRSKIDWSLREVNIVSLDLPRLFSLSARERKTQCSVVNDSSRLLTIYTSGHEDVSHEVINRMQYNAPNV